MKSRRSVPATLCLKVWFIIGAYSFAIGFGNEANFGQQSSDANDDGAGETWKPGDGAGSGQRVYALPGGYLSCENDKNNAANLDGSRMALILSDLMADLRSGGK